MIDGLNELKTLIIGERSFELNETNKNGSECVIMNCDQLCSILIKKASFWWYERIELKCLPSIISIQLDDCTFSNCQSISIESMND